MQVAVAPPEFRFDSSACSSPPYLSAPSSPKRFHDHRQFYTSAPASPTRAAAYTGEEDEYGFAFQLSGPLQSSSALSSADELFDNGKIRPLKPYSSPFMANSRSRRTARSLSPARRSDGARTTTTTTTVATATRTTTTSAAMTIASILRNRGGSKKWRLKDLFLFRSASEGRATNRESRDPLRRYTLLEDSRTSSFRSAAELHYTTSKAAAEERKKKTALPYRQSLFGCLNFNPAILSISREISRHSSDRHR